jgi:hypothetical protein
MARFAGLRQQEGPYPRQAAHTGVWRAVPEGATLLGFAAGFKGLTCGGRMISAMSRNGEASNLSSLPPLTLQLL